MGRSTVWTARKQSLNKRMLTRSAHCFVLADSSKFGTTATYKVAPLNAAKMITDAGLSEQWRTAAPRTRC